MLFLELFQLPALATRPPVPIFFILQASIQPPGPASQDPTRGHFLAHTDLRAHTTLHSGHPSMFLDEREVFLARGTSPGLSETLNKSLAVGTQTLPSPTLQAQLERERALGLALCVHPKGRAKVPEAQRQPDWKGGVKAFLGVFCLFLLVTPIRVPGKRILRKAGK